MKRVRYLAGAVGLAPITLGAAAAGGAHATAAEVAGHGKTVSLQGATRHQRWGPVQDFSRIRCSTPGQWVKVYQSNVTGEDCFVNYGSEAVKIYHIDYVYTGYYVLSFTLSEKGRYFTCQTSSGPRYLWASSCTSLHGATAKYNSATMVRLNIN